ncbi:MAG: hypothetical protein J2P25_12230 [Nocardiopsaceae bacterium]|nr:hypothetical protein [Nocardiopsaceae bacterium]
MSSELSGGSADRPGRAERGDWPRDDDDPGPDVTPVPASADHRAPGMTRQEAYAAVGQADQTPNAFLRGEAGSRDERGKGQDAPEGADPPRSQVEAGGIRIREAPPEAAADGGAPPDPPDPPEPPDPPDPPDLPDQDSPREDRPLLSSPEGDRPSDDAAAERGGVAETGLEQDQPQAQDGPGSQSRVLGAGDDRPQAPDSQADGGTGTEGQGGPRAPGKREAMRAARALPTWPPFPRTPARGRIARASRASPWRKRARTPAPTTSARPRWSRSRPSSGRS